MVLIRLKYLDWMENLFVLVGSFLFSGLIWTRAYDNFLIPIIDYPNRTNHACFELTLSTWIYKINSHILGTLFHYWIIEASSSCSRLSTTTILVPIMSHTKITQSTHWPYKCNNFDVLMLSCFLSFNLILHFNTSNMPVQQNYKIVPWKKNRGKKNPREGYELGDEYEI